MSKIIFTVRRDKHESEISQRPSMLNFYEDAHNWLTFSIHEDQLDGFGEGLCDAIKEQINNTGSARVVMSCGEDEED